MNLKLCKWTLSIKKIHIVKKHLFTVKSQIQTAVTINYFEIQKLKCASIQYSRAVTIQIM